MARGRKFLAGVCDNLPKPLFECTATLTSRKLVCREYGNWNHSYPPGESAIPVSRLALYCLLYICFERLPILSLTLLDDSPVHDVAREVYADDKPSGAIFIHRNFPHGTGDNR